VREMSYRTYSVWELVGSLPRLAKLTELGTLMKSGRPIMIVR